VSVIGCVVNGPGEAARDGYRLTGGGNGTHQVYLSGLTDQRLKDTDIVDHRVELVAKKAAEIEAARRETALPSRALFPVADLTKPARGDLTPLGFHDGELVHGASELPPLVGIGEVAFRSL
jgi:hypothetical protein